MIVTAKVWEDEDGAGREGKGWGEGRCMVAVMEEL